MLRRLCGQNRNTARDTRNKKMIQFGQERGRGEERGRKGKMELWATKSKGRRSEKSEKIDLAHGTNPPTRYVP